LAHSEHPVSEARLVESCHHQTHRPGIGILGQDPKATATSARINASATNAPTAFLESRPNAFGKLATAGVTGVDTEQYRQAPAFLENARQALLLIQGQGLRVRRPHLKLVEALTLVAPSQERCPPQEHPHERNDDWAPWQWTPSLGDEHEGRENAPSHEHYPMGHDGG